MHRAMYSSVVKISLCSFVKSHIKELPHKVRLVELLLPRCRREHDPDPILQLALHSRCRVYLPLTCLVDGENEQDADRWLFEKFAFTLSRYVFTMKGIERGYGWDNEKRARLHLERMTRLLRVIGKLLLYSSFSSSDGIPNNIASSKRIILPLKSWELTPSISHLYGRGFCSFLAIGKLYLLIPSPSPYTGFRAVKVNSKRNCAVGNPLMVTMKFIMIPHL